jgi:hypothetical protein
MRRRLRPQKPLELKTREAVPPFSSFTVAPGDLKGTLAEVYADRCSIHLISSWLH